MDIYAPIYVKASYIDQYDIKQNKKNWSGTSFSFPIVAGVAATIMSENPHKKFNTKKKKVRWFGLKGIIKDVDEDQPNIFINNGNHLRYDYDSGEDDDGDTNDLECFNHGYCLRN